MKKYLFIALALFGLAACAEKMSDENVHNGEVESSFIAITLSTADVDTRADDGVYQEGTADERAVETAYFFFFNEDGTAFPVKVAEGSANAPGVAGTDRNYLQAALTSTTGKDMNNVSDIKNVVLLLKKYAGSYPAKVVAVLNWVPVNDAYSLAELQEELVDVRSNVTGELNGKFVMSNSVYASDTTPAAAISATPLTADNIFTDEVNAKANPVTIFVERAAAKVTVTTVDAAAKFDLSKPVVVAGNSTPVYAKLLGWELYNDYTQSYLLKNIDPAWTNNGLGFTWNDSPWYRSYWAKSQTDAFPENSFQYQYASVSGDFASVYGYAFGLKTDVAAGTYAANTYAYCGENTERLAADRTKVILKAQLVDGSDQPVEIARWYTTEYLGEENLRTAVANTLKYTLYFKDGDNYVGLVPADLQCVAAKEAGAPSDIEAYEVFFQLSTAGEAKTWYKNNGGVMEEISADVATDPKGVAAANVELAKVEPAVLYKSGQTYYYIDIKHLGNGLDAVDTGDYGIVRNHVYTVNVNAIQGYGTPVYIPNSNLIDPEYPEYPGDDENTSFVSAEVRILSWRIVAQEVTVQPQA